MGRVAVGNDVGIGLIVVSVPNVGGVTPGALVFGLPEVLAPGCHIMVPLRKCCVTCRFEPEF